MNDQANAINKMVSQLKELEVLSKDLRLVLKTIQPENQNSQLISISTHISEFSFSELADDLHILSHQLKSEQSSNEQSLEANDLVTSLQNELIERDQRIQDFKLSLADSVVTSSNTKRENELLKEKNSQLYSKISELQMHTKDQTLKLETTSQNLAKCETELKNQTPVLNELRSGNYKYKKLIADYEDQIEDQKNRVEQLSETKAKADHLISRLKKETEYLGESYETLKQTFGSLEERERALEGTIEALQREKNHLQGRLERLLTGVSKNISHSQIAAAIASDSDISTDKMLPYLPFCFPERLPAVIKFKREIRANAHREFSKRPAPSVKVFPSNSVVRIEPATLRIHPAKVVFSPPKARFFQPRVEISQPALELKKYSCQLIPEKLIPTFSDLGTPVRNIKREHKHSDFMPATLIGQSQLELPSSPEFDIFTHSIDLLLSYMSRGIFKDHYPKLTLNLDWIITDTEDNYLKKPLEITNISMEKLAFRYRIQLKSHLMYIARKTILRSIKTSKLKTVLETFGNTISSMVRKYHLSSDQIKDDKKE